MTVSSREADVNAYAAQKYHGLWKDDPSVRRDSNENAQEASSQWWSVGMKFLASDLTNVRVKVDTTSAKLD